MPPPRVVIVEDHELLATSLALALRQQGLVVETVAGHEAEEILGPVRRLAPTLVLLDLDLGPEMGSGEDLIRPLIEAGAQVVMMTGVVERVRLAACVEAGATGIVSKTAGFAALVGTVRRAVEGEVLITESQRQDFLSDLRTWRQADNERWAPFQRLSHREKAVLAGLLGGESAEAIAESSYVSLATVRSQIRAVLLKLGVTSQLAAVAMARIAGWPPAPG